MNYDLELLQVSWTVIALEVDGQKMPASMLANCRISIDGDRFTSMGMGATRICIATRGSVRPSSFASILGSDFAFETLTRGGADYQRR